MEITADKKDLERALARVVPIAERKGPTPVLTCVRVHVEKKKLTLLATDLVLSARAIVEAQVVGEGGFCAVARTLLDLVRSLRDGPVRIRHEEGDKQVVIHAGGGKFRLRVLEQRDFPVSPKPHPESFWWELPAVSLARLIARVRHAMGADSSRPQLMAALLAHDGKIFRMAATDSSRLAVASYRPASASSSRLVEALIPDRGVEELERFCEDSRLEGADDVSFTVAADYIFFKAGSGRLTARLLAEKFPPYEKVTSWNKSIKPADISFASVDRAEFLGALERAVIVSVQARKVSSGIRISYRPEGRDEDGDKLAEGLVVESENTEVGDGEERVAARLTMPGEQTAPLCANVHFILDAVRALAGCERVILSGVLGSLEPLHVEPEGAAESFISVIMPLRV